MATKRWKVTIELELEGDEADEAERVIDDVLDEGTIQDELSASFADRGLDIEIASAMVFDQGEVR